MKQQPWPLVAVFLTLWVALAAAFPTRTLHLAAPIVAGWPLIGRLTERQPMERRQRLSLAVAGLSIATLATFGLDTFGRLEGPSLLPTGDAAFESYVFALGAAVIAIAIAIAWEQK